MLVATMTPLVVVKVFFPDLFEAWFGQGWYGTASMFLIIILAGIGDFDKLGKNWDFDLVRSYEWKGLKQIYKNKFPATGMTLDTHILQISGESTLLSSASARTNIARIMTSDLGKWNVEKVSYYITKLQNTPGIAPKIGMIVKDTNQIFELERATFYLEKGHSVRFEPYNRRFDLKVDNIYIEGKHPTERIGYSTTHNCIVEASEKSFSIKEKPNFPSNGKTRLEIDARIGFRGEEGVTRANYGGYFNDHLNDFLNGKKEQYIDEVYVILDDNSILYGQKNSETLLMNWQTIPYSSG